MKTPISIITGYLGTGKTTLLKKIAESANKKIAILMNEFGEIAIDSKVIKGKNVNMTELAGGCVCCSLTGEFEAAVKEILKKIKPELIIVETTGVAEPDAIVIDLKNLTQVKLDSIITVVDADAMVRFPSLGHTGRIQIEMADVILLNKIDLIDMKQAKEIENFVKKINKNAAVIKTVKCDVDMSLLFGIDVERREVHKKHEHKLDVEYFVFESDKKLSREKFEKMVSKLPKGVYRAKGFVRFDDGNYLFNYVAGRWDFEKSGVQNTKLVFIGNGLKGIKKTIDKLKNTS